MKKIRMPVITYKKFLLKIKIKNGRKNAAIMDPRDTYPETRKINDHKRKEPAAATGKRASITPKLQLTPFPPFPFKKME